MLLVTLISLALAHPGSALGGGEMGPAIVGQRLELRLDRNTTSLAYVAELPLRRVSEEARTWSGEGTFAMAKLEELKGGLVVHHDGALVPLEWQSLPDAARTGESGFIELHLLGSVARAIPRGRVTVRNANFPDEPGFHATYVWVAGDRVVTATSLFRVKEGRLRGNTHGAWVRDEAAREPWVEVREAWFWEKGDDGSAPERAAGLGPSPAGVATLLVAGATVLAGGVGAFVLHRRKR